MPAPRQPCGSLAYDSYAKVQDWEFCTLNMITCNYRSNIVRMQVFAQRVA